ncbi:Uma2 family endonuclease [Atlanticothrix silvestris]|uniref:Uma2 family endonuclease n=1 Tax=Atlanticothrix silvestris TaxID=2840444 RepID=UPI001CED7F3E|nr:Uma2 family endonuclease [Atlanticothrix silvestris]
MKYLEGTLEIMSPSRRHEFNKKIIALLVEAHFLEIGIDFYPLGSTTFRKQTAARGIEPNECYCFNSEKSIPDLAIEVVVTSGGIDDLVIYQGLEVPEVWFWQNHQFSLYYLRGNKYESISKSEFLPNLDSNVLASFVMSDEKPREIILKFLQHIRKSNS